MLTWEPDKERILESTFHDSIPFLLFAPDEFRDELILNLRGLYKSSTLRATENFNQDLKRIDEMLKDYDFGETINNHIAHLRSTLKPLYQTLAEHSIKLQELEKEVKSLKKNNKNSTKLKSSTIENTRGTVDSKRSLDDIKAIGNEYKSLDKEITNTQLKFKNKKDMEINTAPRGEITAPRGEITAPTTQISLVLDYLKNVRTPVTHHEIAPALDITPHQATQALYALVTKKAYQEIQKNIQIGKGYSLRKTDSAKIPCKTFQWIENLESNLSSNDKTKFKWILPLYSHSESI